MRAGADLRLLRAAVFAAACATLAATGHLSATGPGLPLWTMAAGWAAAFAVALPLSGRERRSVPALAATLAAGQLALHLLYCLGQHTTAAATATTSGGGHGGPVALAARLLCNDRGITLTESRARQIVAAAGLDPDTSATHAAARHTATGLADALASLASAPMLLGHLLAALAAGWLLRRGEAALWQLIRLSARRSPDSLARCLLPPPLARAWQLIRALCGGPLPRTPAVRPPRTGHHPVPAAHGTVLTGAVTRRGPPAHRARHLALAA